jgi:hypothetical protein
MHPVGIWLPGIDIKGSLMIQYTAKARRNSAARRRSAAPRPDRADPIVSRPAHAALLIGREADGSPSAPWSWEDLDLCLHRNQRRAQQGVRSGVPGEPSSPGATEAAASAAQPVLEPGCSPAYLRQALRVLVRRSLQQTLAGGAS